MSHVDMTGTQISIRLPRVPISQRVMPKDQTSEADVNSLAMMDSMAIHFSGTRPVRF